MRNDHFSPSSEYIHSNTDNQRMRLKKNFKKMFPSSEKNSRWFTFFKNSEIFEKCCKLISILRNYLLIEPIILKFLYIVSASLMSNCILSGPTQNIYQIFAFLCGNGSNNALTGQIFFWGGYILDRGAIYFYLKCKYKIQITE